MDVLTFFLIYELGYDGEGKIVSAQSQYEPPALSPMPTPAVSDPSTYFSYNVDGQLTQITRPDGGTIAHSYDADSGQLLTKTLPGTQGTLQYSYYPSTTVSGAGQLQNIIAPDGGVLGYSYYGPLLFQETWDGSAVSGGGVSGSVERVYDNHMRVIGQTVNFNTSEQVNFSFDADGFMTAAGALTMSRHAQHGLLTGTTLGEVTDSYERNGFGEVTEYTASVDGTPVLEIDYERDSVGRITRKTESVEGGSPVDTYYVYDAAGRLHRVCDDEPADGECLSERAEYEYDSNSNRTGGHDHVSGSITATYDSQDRLLSYNGVTYTYTANGELASKTDSSGTTTYDYDALGNLRKVVLHAEDPNEVETWRSGTRCWLCDPADCVVLRVPTVARRLKIGTCFRR